MSKRPRRRRALVGVAVLAAALSATDVAGLACGFHDDVTLARGILNWVYPDALHVEGATAVAVAERRLPPPDVRPGPDRFGAGYRATALVLNRLREALGVAPEVP